MSEYPTVNTLLGLWPLLTAKDMKIDGCDSTLELWIVGNHRVAALLADIPFRPLQHRPGTIVEGAVGAAYDPIYHSWCLPPLAVPFLV